MLKTYFAVGLGGALGAMSRVFLCHIIPASLWRYLPLQILTVNVLGCFIMGLLTGIMSFYWQPNPAIKSFLTTGFLGGFTTFSSFSMEFGLLIERDLIFPAISYVILSVGLSLICFFVGLKLVEIHS
ncbi:fluoride efflux transporter CrcB [Candidatus Paracaedibacter symbiosus]|uniref:fluoride efflux transporter CrcB n=1 Tax=Candidatus Paracaedibacter symbiosus TaxID=244582 RepID=UPI000509E08D|nr:fluoride efflux transporter CrcB [Candidatus Paracaedibacter symbiosus]